MQSTFLMNKVRGKKNYTYIGSCNVHSYWYTVHSLKLVKNTKFLNTCILEKLTCAVLIYKFYRFVCICNFYIFQF